MLGGIIEDFQGQYQRTVAGWNDALQRLDYAGTLLSDVRDYALSQPDLAGNQESLEYRMSIFSATVSTVQNVVTQISEWFGSASEWLSDLTGSGGDGLNLFDAEYGSGLNGLNSIVALPWALIATIATGTAAALAIIASVNSHWTEATNRRIAEENIARSQRGEAALPYVTEESTGLVSGLGSAANLLKWLVIGVGVIALLPAITKRLR